MKRSNRGNKGNYRCGALALIGSAMLVACGGGGGSSGGGGGGTQTYTIGGMVGGLSGAGLMLQDNGGNNLSVNSNGAFTFSTPVSNGGAYAVTVATQPTSQTCTVAAGSGMVSGGNVTNVAVTCKGQTYTIGGTASGVTGAGLVLKDNGGDSLHVASNGPFTFATALANGASYAVTVGTPPANENCAIANGTGKVNGANITNVAVSCGSGHTIGGTVSGLKGSGLVLQDNGGDNLGVAANGNFTFATTLSSGQAYAVTVTTQPGTPAQYCNVSSGSGIIGAANVGNVSITCRSTGQFLYVSTTFPGSGLLGLVSLFDIDPTTGLLSRVSRYQTPWAQPFGLALDSSGQDAYIAYEDGSNIDSVVANGAAPIAPIDGVVNVLNGPNPATVFNGADTSTFSLAVDPAAAYLFAGGTNAGTGSGGSGVSCINGLAGRLFNYSISAGVLTELNSGPYIIDGIPCGLAIDPAGQFVFAAINVPAELVVFSINADGSLNELSSGPFQNGGSSNTPFGIAVYPTGGYVFVTDNTADTVSVYSYSAAGALSQVGNPYPVGGAPESVTVDPTGQFLYVANSKGGTVWGFTINAATGALTSINGSPFDTGQGGSTTPTAVAVEPSGQYLYVANGDASTVSIFGIVPGTGVLTAVGPAPSCTSVPDVNCTIGNYYNGPSTYGSSVLVIQ